MKSLDYMEYLDSFTAEVVVLSTYNFDPVFFERRILRRKALEKAQRIAVLVDADEWGAASRSDQPIRWANCRYLVVPVSRRRGVFHPKLHLFLSEKDAVVSCGSGNLTRPGITHNLELQNIFHAVSSEGEWSSSAQVASDALQFFQSITSLDTFGGSFLLAQWLKECWSYQLPGSVVKDGPKLLNTAKSGLWEPVSREIDAANPHRIKVLSPFFDDDLALLRRLRDRWPNAKIEVIAQSHTSRLNANLLADIDQAIGLANIANGARRLHAKLLAWDGEVSSGCLVGSANFTTAAFDGRNVEVSVLLSETTSLIDTVFSGDCLPTTIDPEEFVASDSSEPAQDSELDEQSLLIHLASLDTNGRLTVEYVISEPEKWTSVSIGLRAFRDSDPAIVFQIAKKSEGKAFLDLSDTPFASSNGAIRCSLIALHGDERTESPVVWVVQESQLTRERGISHSNRVRRQIEQSGSLLFEQMNEVGSQQGYGGMIEFLDQVNIRFSDGGGRLAMGRSLSIRISDPWTPGATPSWSDDVSTSAEDLERLGRSICEYADRHEKTKLRKHARQGNINGVENYCDILASMTQMLVAGFAVWRRGQVPSVPRNQVIGRLCRYIEISTLGCDSPRSRSPGYLLTLRDNLVGDKVLFKARCESADIAGLLVMVLRTAQRLRALADDTRDTVNINQLLPGHSRTLAQTFTECGLDWPPDDEVRDRWQTCFDQEG